MKPTIYAGLESLMFEALNNLKNTHEELARAHIILLKYKDQESATNYSKAQIEVDSASERYSELLTAKKIIKEMEAKGIEI